MSFGLPELAEAVRHFLHDNLPGRTPLRVAIFTVEDERPLSVPIGTPVRAVPQEEETFADDGKRSKFSACTADILEVLEKVGKPLTTTRILAELSKTGKEWSDRWVAELLSRMVKDGTLDNPPDGRPRGYRLPE